MNGLNTDTKFYDKGACEGAKRQASRVETALESLFAQSQSLEIICSTLIDRVQPVSTPQPTQPIQGGPVLASTNKAQGYMLDQIEMIQTKLDGIHHRVRAAIDLLEI